MWTNVRYTNKCVMIWNKYLHEGPSGGVTGIQATIEAFGRLRDAQSKGCSVRQWENPRSSRRKAEPIHLCRNQWLLNVLVPYADE